MKIVLMLSFFISTTAYALNCKEIKNDIMAIEYVIQNSKAKACKNCKSKNELNLEYNNILAELIIAEGIASLDMTITSHHNALNDLSPRDITNARKDLEKLNNSLDTASLINEGLNFIDGTTVFSKFEGKTSAELKDYLSNECKTTPFKSSTFCTDFKTAKNNPSQMKTLTGFLLTDQQILQSDRERKPRYETYQDALKIQLGDKSFSPSEFKKQDHFQDITKLQKALEAFGELKRKKQDVTKEVAEIIKLSQSIKPISTHYSSSATADFDVTKYFQKNFHRVLAQMDLPDLILEGRIKDNFLNTSLKLDNDFKLREKSLNSKFAKYLTKKSALASGGRSIKSICNGDYGSSCLRKVCGETSKRKPETCEAFQSINLDKEYQELKQFDAQKGKLSVLENARNCMEADLDLIKKKKCLTNLQTTKTPIGKLRKKLNDKMSEIKGQSRNAPFPVLYEQKALAISELNSNYCRQDYDLLRFNGAKVDCPQPSPIGASETVLNLGLDGEKVMIKLKNDLVRKSLDGMLSKNEINTQKEKIKKMCQQGSAKLRNLCRHYQDEDTFKAAWEETIEAKNNVVYIDTNRPEEAYGFSDALKASAPIWVQGIPSIVQGKLEESMVRQDTKNTLNSISNYNTYYMNNLNNYRAWQETNENSNSTGPFAFNFGYQNTSSSGVSNFQYDANQTSNLFANASPLTFAYTPITTFTTSSTSNTPFQWNF